MLVPGLTDNNTEGHQKCQLGVENALKGDFSLTYKGIGGAGGPESKNVSQGRKVENGTNL